MLLLKIVMIHHPLPWMGSLIPGVLKSILFNPCLEALPRLTMITVTLSLSPATTESVLRILPSGGDGDGNVDRNDVSIDLD